MPPDLIISPSLGSGSRFPRGRDLVWAPENEAASQPHPRRTDRILIIEDDLLIASQIEGALTDAGFDVIGVVMTGEEALEAASTEPPDLAVVDIRLAGDRDGLDTPSNYSAPGASAASSQALIPMTNRAGAPSPLRRWVGCKSPTLWPH